MSVFKSNTFKDFFHSKFLSERAYMKFNPHHFEHIYYREMANPGVGEHLGDVPKHPIGIDKEDIDFLKQFPSSTWRQALKKRYDMLHDALLHLHDKRMEMGFKELEQKIKKAMTDSWKGDSSSWNELSDVLSPDVINRLKNEYSPEAINRNFGSNEFLIKKTIGEEAHKEAYEEIKSKSEGIEDSPEPVEFQFKSGTYYAKPHLNRLYHKLERTKDQPHDPKSGLSDFNISHGQYGYDLAFPKNHSIENNEKRTTRGVGAWPSTPTVNQNVNDLWNLNQHHVFGDLEVPEGAIWKKIKGDSGKGFKDYHIWNQAEDRNFKKIVADMKREEGARSNKQFRTMDMLTAEARKQAHAATIRDAEAGKLVAPPVPGVDAEDRKVRIVGGKPVLPDVYLPHIKTKVKVKNEVGQIVDKDEWVPVVNPSHFYRELGKEESDYLHDDEGRRTGDFDIENLKDRMTGHPDERGIKPYVRVDSSEYDKSGDKGHQAPAAFHLNQNSKGRFFISRGDQQYAEYYKKVFGDMEIKRYADQGGAEMWTDFRDGIMRCLAGARCGDAGPDERMAVLMQLPSIHGIIVTQALNNLGNPKLHTKLGRKSFAESLVGSFVQTNLGQGTRRQRILDKNARDVSRDTTTSGSEGGSLSIADTLDSQSRDKNDFGQTTTRGRGGRLMGSSNWIDSGGNTNYNVDEFRQVIAKIESEAREADQESSYDIGSDDIDSLKDNTLDKANVIAAIRNHLVGLSRHTGRDSEGLERDIEDEIKDWIKDGASTASDLVAKFEAHPLVVAKVGQPNAPQGQEPQQAQEPKTKMEPTPEVLDAIEKLKEDETFKRLIKLKNSPDWERVKNVAISQMKLQPMNGEKYSKFINNFADAHLELNPANTENSLEMLQDFLDDELQNPNQQTSQPTEPRTRPIPTDAPAQPAIAARSIQQSTERPPGAVRNPTNDSAPFHSLRNNKQWLDFVHHPDFVDVYPKTPAGPGMIMKAKAKMDDWLGKGYISAADHASAIAKINAAISNQQR